MEDAEYKVAAVERALAILEAFTGERIRMSLAEIIQATGLSKTTALRLIQSLEDHGLLGRAPDEKYCIGSRSLQLANLHQLSFEPMEIIVPALRRLVTRTEESAAFNVRNGENRVCVYRIDSPHRIRDHVQLGDVIPLDHGAAGHIIRAFSGARGALYDTIRRRGFAMTVGEVTPDTAALAAPIFQAGDRLLGSIAVSGPRSRLDKMALRRVEPILLGEARELTSLFGGNIELIPASTNSSDVVAPARRGVK
jgi:DNA-binding IclR family transcriptional regulator